MLLPKLQSSKVYRRSSRLRRLPGLSTIWHRLILYYSLFTLAGSSLGTRYIYHMVTRLMYVWNNGFRINIHIYIYKYIYIYIYIYIYKCRMEVPVRSTK